MLACQLIISNEGEAIDRVSDETCIHNTDVVYTQMGPTTAGTDGSVFNQMGRHNPHPFHPPA
jgi:hypothetical protein